MQTSDPNASALALVHQGWEQLRRQRPLAAWSSWQQALRVKPGDPAASQALEILALADDLPLAARFVRRFRAPRETDRARWDTAFRERDMQDLKTAAETFQRLAADNLSDPAALYNLGLCRAWLGENALAKVALDAFVCSASEDEPEAAIEAAMLGQILGQTTVDGPEGALQAGDVSDALTLAWPRDAGDPVPRLTRFAQLQPAPVPLDPATGGPVFPDARAFEWLDRPMPEASAGLGVDDLPRVLASVVVTPGSVRVSSTDRWGLKSAEWAMARELSDLELTPVRTTTPLPLRLMDADVWTFRIPSGMDEQARLSLTRDATERYFEHRWVHMPRTGLLGPGPENAASPLATSRLARTDTAREAAARVRLEAAIRLREQLAARPRVAPLYGGYPFDRLRRRLGLDPTNADTVDRADVSCMDEQELGRFDSKTADLDSLRDVYRSALGLLGEADPVVVRLARAIIARDFASLLREDFPPLLTPLILGALEHDDIDGALAWLDRADGLRGGRLKPEETAWRDALMAESGRSRPTVTAKSSTGAPASLGRVVLDTAESLLAEGHAGPAIPLLRVAASQPGDAGACASELLHADPFERFS